MRTKPHAVQKLADYLVKHGFAGNIPINEGAKNWRAVKKLVQKEDFYTFGIAEIKNGVKARKLTAASGLNLKRFNLKGAGYFDPAKSSAALLEGIKILHHEASTNKRLVFATGHPGAMVGLLSELAAWSASIGAEVVVLDRAVMVKPPFFLDQIGTVLVPSDGCSAWHSHETVFLKTFLETHAVDMVIGDHGFVGSALNHNIASIGFYDTDDPAMPLAQFMGLPVHAIPINDNRPNADSAALARFLIRLVS
jgi:hypothetical protein